MAVSGPAGILTFYLLSALGFFDFFKKKNGSNVVAVNEDLIKYIIGSLSSIVALFFLRNFFKNFNSKKVLNPAEQIVMDVRRLNINFTFDENSRKKPDEP